MTDADKDQDHIEIIIYNKTSIPDRTSYIIGESNKSPVGSMVEAGKALEQLKVDYLAIPCITAHNFYDELASNLETPIVHAVEETSIYLKENGLKTVGIMATKGTVISKIFQNKLKEYEINAVIPNDSEQEDISHII